MCRHLLSSCGMSDDIMCMELWWDDTDMGKSKLAYLQRNLSQCHSLRLIPDGLAWVWKRPSAVKDRRLSWAMARLNRWCLYTILCDFTVQTTVISSFLFCCSFRGLYHNLMILSIKRRYLLKCYGTRTERLKFMNLPLSFSWALWLIT